MTKLDQTLAEINRLSEHLCSSCKETLSVDRQRISTDNEYATVAASQVLTCKLSCTLTPLLKVEIPSAFLILEQSLKTATKRIRKSC